jgi:hypothetical protein
LKTRNIILLILIFLAIVSLTISIFLCNGDLKNILIGIFSSAFVVITIETVALTKDYCLFSILSEDYKRIKITITLDNRNPLGIYEDITDRYVKAGVNSAIKLKYRGDGEYQGRACYEEGEVMFTINLDKTNPKIGHGVYQYISKKHCCEMPDLGIYKIQLDTLNSDRLFVYYSNVVPNGLARGYEIWTK